MKDNKGNTQSGHTRLKTKLKSEVYLYQSLTMFRALFEVMVQYGRYLLEHNPLKVFYRRQHRMDFLHNYEESMIKPRISEKVLDMFLSDTRRRQRLLNWVRKQIGSHIMVYDFCRGWQDGTALCALLESICPGVCPSYHLLSILNRVKNCRLGFKLANKYLYVPMDLISAEEMAIASKSTETKVIQYIFMVKWASENIKDKWSTLHESLIAAKAGRCFAKGLGLKSGVVDKKSKFTILVSDTIGVFNLLVEVRGPNHEYCGERVVSLHQARALLDKSFDYSAPQADNIRYMEDCAGNTFVRKKVPCRYDENSTNDLIQMEVKCGEEGTFYVSFVPRRAVMHSVSIKWQNHHVDNSPFRVKVYKAANVSTKTLKGAQEKRVIYDSISFSSHSTDALEKPDEIGQDVTDVDTHKLSAMAKAKAYGKGRQLTVTRRRVIRRIITRNGEDIVIEEAISPTISRQSSFNDISDEDSRHRRAESDENTTRTPESRNSPATLTISGTLGAVPEEPRKPVTKPDNRKCTVNVIRSKTPDLAPPCVLPKADIVTRKKENNTTLLQNKTSSNQFQNGGTSQVGRINDVTEHEQFIGVTSFPHSATESDTTTDGSNKQHVKRQTHSRRLQSHPYDTSATRRHKKKDSAYKRNGDRGGLSDTSSDMSSSELQTSSNSGTNSKGMSMKVLHSSSLKKACMYMTNKSLSHPMSSLTDAGPLDEGLTLDMGVTVPKQQHGKPQPQSDVQTLPLIRTFWNTNAETGYPPNEQPVTAEKHASLNTGNRSEPVFINPPSPRSQVNADLFFQSSQTPIAKPAHGLPELSGPKQGEVNSENGTDLKPKTISDLVTLVTQQAASSVNQRTGLTRQTCKSKASEGLSSDNTESIAGSIRSMSVNDGSEKSGSTKSSSAKSEGEKSGSVKSEPVKSGSANSGSVKSEPAKNGSAKTVEETNRSIKQHSETPTKFSCIPNGPGIKNTGSQDSTSKAGVTHKANPRVSILIPKATADKSTLVTDKEIIAETKWTFLEGVYLQLRKVYIKSDSQNMVHPDKYNLERLPQDQHAYCRLINRNVHSESETHPLSHRPNESDVRIDNDNWMVDSENELKLIEEDYKCSDISRPLSTTNGEPVYLFEKRHNNSLEVSNDTQPDQYGANAYLECYGGMVSNGSKYRGNRGTHESTSCRHINAMSTDATSSGVHRNVRDTCTTSPGTHNGAVNTGVTSAPANRLTERLRNTRRETEDSGYEDVLVYFNRRRRSSLPVALHDLQPKMCRQAYHGPQNTLETENSITSMSESTHERGNDADDETGLSTAMTSPRQEPQRRSARITREASFSFSDSELDERCRRLKYRSNAFCKSSSSACSQITASQTDNTEMNIELLKRRFKEAYLMVNTCSKLGALSNPARPYKSTSICSNTSTNTSSKGSIADEIQTQPRDSTSSTELADLELQRLTMSASNERATDTIGDAWTSESVESSYNGFGVSRPNRHDLLAELGAFQRLKPSAQVPVSTNERLGTHGGDMLTSFGIGNFSISNLTSYAPACVEQDQGLGRRVGMRHHQTPDESDTSSLSRESESSNGRRNRTSAQVWLEGAMNYDDRDVTSPTFFDMFSSIDHSDHSSGENSENIVKYGDVVTIGMPERLMIFRLAGVGLQHGYVGNNNTFQVWVENPLPGSLAVNVVGPQAHSVTETSVLYTGDNLYEVAYGVTQPGLYKIYAKWGEYNITDVPYVCEVTF